MLDRFQAIIDKYREPMAMLRDVLERDRRILAVSVSDPTHSILLTRNGSSAAPWRVTSFSRGQPLGHREYDVLDGRGPTQNALAEFAGDGWTLVRRTIPRREMESRTREANEALQACAEAITRAPDEAAKAMFERSHRIWQHKLEVLKS
jgi:hypothetical protein